MMVEYIMLEYKDTFMTQDECLHIFYLSSHRLSYCYHPSLPTNTCSHSACYHNVIFIFIYLFIYPVDLT